MKLFGKISNGYKKIASGIAIVAFLTMLYFAMIPGVSLAHVYGPDGGILSGVFVFIKEWPQYNTTTDINGAYAINSVPYGEYTLVAAGNDSYAPNISTINVSASSNPRDVNLKPAIRYYLPYLYNTQADVYKSAVQIQNGGMSNASTEITYYNNTGLVGNDFNIIQSNKLTSENVFNVTGEMVSFNGPAYIKSDMPLIVGGYIRTMASDVYSMAPSFTDADISTTLYIPYVYQSNGLYDSGIQVFNPGTDSADVILTNYYTNGTIANSTAFTLSSKKMQGTRISYLMPGISFYNGPVEITSNRPVAAQSFIRTSGSVYSIAPAINTPVTNVTIPYIYQSTGTYDGGIQVFNPGTESADVILTIYYSNGTIANSTSFTLTSKKLQGTRISYLMPGVSFHNGPAFITSTKPIVAQAYIRSSGTIYSIAPQVRKPESLQETHLSYLMLTSTHNGGVQVFNPNNVNATVNVSLYYANGSFGGKNSFELNPYGFRGTRLSDYVPSGFIGYSNISSNQTIVAQGYIRTTSSGVYSIEAPLER